MTISRKVRTCCGLCLTVLVALGGLAGCSGGSSGGGGQFAGIEGTGIVSGFGSIYVNGTEFVTEDARILFNGERSSESRLRVGDVVRVTGFVDDDGNAVASRIVFDRNVDGPIRRIEIAADDSGELVALGQIVRFDAETHFIGRNGTDMSARDLSVGDLIAVSGVGDESGALLATSIERGGDYTAGTTVIDVEGRARDVSDNRFRIGNQVIEYDSDQLGAQPLAEDDYIQVFGLQYTADGALTATRVERPERRLGDDGERVFIEGMVSDLRDEGAFSLSGQRIDARDAERNDEAIETPLRNGLEVSIEGRRQGETIVADRLAVEPAPTITLEARVNRIDEDSDRIDVLGTQWQIQPDTLYLDRTRRADRQLRLDRLAAGDTIRATGYSRDGDGSLVMTRLDRVEDNARGDAMVRGSVDGVQRDGDAVTISVAGTAIVAQLDNTEFLSVEGESIAADAFLAALQTGSNIIARGPDNASRIDIARTVQLLD